MNKNAEGDWRSETKEYMAGGIAQFWESTYNTYTEKYNLKKDYWNPYSQIDLTARIIALEKNGWRHWFNCSKRVGFNKSIGLELAKSSF